ncbi:MAG TPA: hypothetical protein VE631_06310, partial [Alphaproteobacteria bacterium]|nr:hypothetical protein [Alphaproteobacteria bacterium]
MQSSPRSERQIHVIAEMACSHDGNPALGRTIIDAAGAAGADAVQFQIWHLPDMMVRRHPAYPAVEKLALSREDWAGLARHVRRQ